MNDTEWNKYKRHIKLNTVCPFCKKGIYRVDRWDITYIRTKSSHLFIHDKCLKNLDNKQ